MYPTSMPRNDGFVLVQHAICCAWVREQGGNVRTTRRLTVGRWRQRVTESRVCGQDGFVAKQGRLSRIGRRRHGWSRNAVRQSRDSWSCSRRDCLFRPLTVSCSTVRNLRCEWTTSTCTWLCLHGSQCSKARAVNNAVDRACL